MQGKREIRDPANMGAGRVVGNVVYCIDFGQNDNNLMCQLSKSGVE